MVEGASHAAGKKLRRKASIKHHLSNPFNRIKTIITDTTFITAVAGFFIGRVVILKTLSPFGLAFFTAVSLKGEVRRNAIVGIGIAFGLATSAAGTEAIQPIASLMLIFLAVRMLHFDSKTPVIKAAAIAFFISFTVALCSNLIINRTFILEDTLIGLFNSTIAMALIYIYNYCLPVLSGIRKRRLLSNEEAICMSILCATIISGLSDAYAYGVSLKAVLSVFIIAVTGYVGGAGFGAAIGTILGLITCISSDQVPVITGAYAFSGLATGIFKDVGKTGSCLGFIMASVVMNLYLGPGGEAIGTKELALGLLIFVLFPQWVINKALPFVDRNAKNLEEQQSYVERIKDMMQNKIMSIKDVFTELSKALADDESNPRVRQNAEANALINSIADKVCADCDARNICWKRDLYCTYQSMFQMIDVIQSDGKVDIGTLPADLGKKCIRASQLTKTANYVFDIYRINYKWRLKAKEAKKVVGEQLQGIAGILNGLSDEIKHDIRFKDDIEDELAITLDKEGIDFNDIVVAHDRTGRMEVNIYKSACLGKRECIKDVVPVVSRVLKRRMKRDRSACVLKDGTNLCYFKLIEALKYQVSTGIAREVKDEGGLSGDNYSFIELSGGKYMMALSDGMGTGPAAAMESNSAITLLERYLEAGFNKATAIRAINSAMSLRSPDDNFTTMDLCITDLYTGEAELIKIGAASTFIKRYDGTCETIFSTTLPIGIVNNLEYETKNIKLAHGDLLVMITDGVQESGGGGDGSWVAKALEEIDSRNVQQVAEQLLSKAKERDNGEITDDMTVLVSKVWEVL